MKLLKKDEGIKQQSLGLEESFLKNSVLNLRHRVVKFGREVHYSGIYTNFWLWNIIFANIAIGTVLMYLIQKSYSKLPQNIGLNLDTSNGYDYIIKKQVIYSPIIVHVLISIITFIFVFKQGKKSNHLLILLLLNIFVLAFFEIMGVRHLMEYFK